MDPNHPNDRALHRKLERLTELIRDADLRLARMPVLRGSIEVHADRSKLEATIGGLTQHLSDLQGRHIQVLEILVLRKQRPAFGALERSDEHL